MKLSLIIIVVLCPLLIFGQKRYTTENNSAIKMYEGAKVDMINRDYKSAAKKLKKALKKDPEFVEAHIQMAKIYKFNFVSPMEKYHYEKAVEYNESPTRFTTIYYILGNMYFREGKYEKSKELYTQYVESGKGRGRGLEEAKRNLKACEFALEAMKDSLRIEPRMMPPQINAFTAQYFPSLTANEYFIVYTAVTGAASKENDAPKEEKKGRNIPQGQSNREMFNKTNENVLVSRKDQNGEWMMARSISPNINSDEYNEGATAISGDGKTIVMTICGHPESYGDCDLFYSYRIGNDWSIPRNLGEKINTKFKETYPTLSPDGRTMYFVSDRPGGQGGLDIWRSDLEPDGWAAPDNIGPPINSPGNEVSPFIHANNRTLYFGSDYHLGFGGYDNFMSEVTAESWTKPVNLGYPLNTYFDEGTLYINPSGERGYYSRRMGNAANAVRHGLNIKLFEFDVPPDVRPSVHAGYAQGLVLDIETGAKLEADIDLYDLKKNKLLQKVHSDRKNGDYVVTLNHGGEYALYISKQGYLFESVNFNFVEDSVENIEMDIKLKPIQIGQSIVLNNLFFESGSYKLNKKSTTELNKIINWMEENPRARVEISGHTDNVGSAAYNQTLSLNRANEVKKYLSENGVNSFMLTAKGYGMNKPIADNTTEEGRKKNRRIEFTIIKGFDDYQEEF